MTDKFSGIEEGLSFAAYHAIEAWGSSSLKAMRQGPPARVMWERAHQRAASDAMRLGTAAHCLLLTPGLFASAYVVKPDGMSFATKDGRAWRADVDDGVIILTYAEYVALTAIHAALTEKDLVRSSLLAATHREASIVWTCPQSGELCKGRPDWIARDGRTGFIYDLKVTRHAGKSIAYRAFVEGWMHQLAHYRTGAQALGLDIDGGRLVVVEPTAPHFVYAIEVKRDALDLFEMENIGTLQAMKECREAGIWPGTPDSWEKIEPPPTAMVEFGELTTVIDAEEEA